MSFKLQLIHSSDNESNFKDVNTLEDKVVNYASITDGLQDEAAAQGWASLHVTAGDHTLPNLFYSAGETTEGKPGLADIKIFNAMGVKANGIGNHEMDGNIGEFIDMVNASDYVHLSANLDFSSVVDTDGNAAPFVSYAADEPAQSVEELAGKIAPSAYVEIDGEQIGLIGRSPSEMFSLVADGNLPGLDYVGGTSGEGTAREPVLEPLPLIQAEIDRLTNQGINKIIFIDHAQDYTDQSVLPAELHGVDVIIQAGMTGDMSAETPSGPFNLLRTEEAGNPITHNYPLESKDSAGKTVLITNTEQIWRYVGHLLVHFDDNGEITSYDADNSGPVPTNDEGVAALRAWTSGDAVADPVVVSTYEALLATDELNAAFAEVGTTTDSLNGVRADIRSRETNLGRLAADSTLWYANQYLEEIGETKRADIALKNGGGIRDTIAGLSPITQLQVNAALAFDNKLTIMDLTGAEFLAIVENGVSRAPALDGRFPHFAGAELDFVTYRPGIEEALSLSEASRVQNLTVNRDDGSTVELVSDFSVNADALEETFTLATNNYQAGGGDGYQAFVPLENKIETVIGEQEILATYISEELAGAVDISDADVIASPRTDLIRPQLDDLINPSDELIGTSGDDELKGKRRLGGNSLYGKEGDDSLKGRKGDDLLDGGSGDDVLKGFGGSDVYVGSAGTDRINGFSFDQGDVVAIDSSINFEIVQSANPNKNLRVEHDLGEIIFKGIKADQLIDLQNSIQITEAI